MLGGPLVSAPAARASHADRLLQDVIARARTGLLEAFPHSRAIVLAGSLSRSEGTVLPLDSGPVILSDLDLALIFTSAAERDAASARLPAWSRAFSRAARPLGLWGAVDVGAYTLPQLSYLPPSPGTRELREHGVVLAGDAGVLELVPEGDPRVPTREEALLLCENRLLELLWTHPALERPLPAPWMGAYAGGKAVLDGVLAWLVSCGECPDEVETRCTTALARWSRAGARPAVRELPETLRFWTEFKLEPRASAVLSRFGSGAGEAATRAACAAAWREGAVTLLTVYGFLLAEPEARPEHAAEARVKAWRMAARRAPLRRRMRRWYEAWRNRGPRELEWAGAWSALRHAPSGSPEHLLGAAAAAVVATAPGMNGPATERTRCAAFASRVTPVSWPESAPWDVRRQLLVRGWDRWVLKGTRSGPEDTPWNDR